MPLIFVHLEKNGDFSGMETQAVVPKKEETEKQKFLEPLVGTQEAGSRYIYK